MLGKVPEMISLRVYKTATGPSSRSFETFKKYFETFLLLLLDEIQFFVYLMKSKTSKLKMTSQRLLQTLEPQSKKTQALILIGF